MAGQEQKESRKRVEELLEEKGLTDMIINGKQTIDSVISPMPRMSSAGSYSASLESLEKELNDFEIKYAGTPDKEVTKRTEGKFQAFMRKMVGGYETVIEKGKPGVYQEGLALYDQAKNNLEEATKLVPDIKRGISVQENYQSKLEKYLKQHSDIFFQCESKHKDISSLMTEFEERYDDPQTSTDEKRAIKGYMDKLRQKDAQVRQTMSDVQSRAVVFKNNLDYIRSQVHNNTALMSVLDTRIATNYANLEGFKVQIDTLPVTYNIIMATKMLNEATSKMIAKTAEIHELQKKTAEVGKTLLIDNPDVQVYNDSMIGDMRAQNEDFSDAMRANHDEMYNQAKAIFLGLD